MLLLLLLLLLMLQLPIKEQLSQVPAQRKVSSLLAIMASNNLAAGKRGFAICCHLQHILGVASPPRDQQPWRKGFFKFANFFAGVCFSSSDASWNSKGSLKDNG